MAKKFMAVICLVALAVCSAQAQKRKISKEEEIAQLKQAYKEASLEVERLGVELAERIKEVDGLLVKSKELEKVKSENEELKKQIAQLQAAPSKTDKAGIVPVALFFEVGKPALGAKERVNLEFYLENAIEANPSRVFTIMSIEDTSSGSKNRELAKKRADHVYNLLVQKYGVARERVVNKGVVGKDLYEDANLNRVVIIK